MPGAQSPRTRTGLFVILALLAAFVLVQFFSSNKLEALRYDEFKVLVRSGQVEEVWISTDSIQGRKRASADSPEAAAPPQQEPLFGTRADFETTRVEDEELTRELERYGVRYSGRSDGGQWIFMLLYVGLPLLVMIWFWRGMMRRVGGGAGGILSFGKSKGKVFSEKEVKVTFDDVAGVDEAKEELQEIIEFLSNPEKFTRIGARIPKGVLLVGPPGTGKTLLARAVAGEAKVPFFSISGSEFVEMFVGVGAARVRDLFEQAKAQAPAIVFIDELDALGRSRGAGVMGGNEEREQTLNQLLVEMDGFEQNAGVILMAATNRPEILDGALLRPGRFDRQVLVDRPDRTGREAILRIHAKDVKLADDVDLGEIASRTPGFAGADLANIVNEGALLAARKGQDKVEEEDLSEAIDRVVAGLEKKNRILTESEKERVAYHESGHAIVGEVLAPTERVAKISIIPRGVAALGYTMQLPMEDRYLLTESELHGKLAALLGGRAAEEIVFGELSTGASNDLSRATEIARAMVVDYGMSEKIGPISMAKDRRPAFLPPDYHPGREVGDRTADAIDEEIRALVERAASRARETLTTHRAVLDAMARRLIEAEHLEGDDLRSLLDRAHAAKPREPALPEAPAK